MTFVAFPSVLASAFSGFYLAFFLLLWCLILRGISIEARNQVGDSLWREAWDFAFAVSNLLLAVLIGVALGNVVRGVPLDAQGEFSIPFFTHFGVRGRVGILDWYTLSVAAFVVLLFSAHGASFLVLKTTGPVHDRSARAARRLWPAALVLLAVMTLETAYVRPDLFAGMIHRPVAWFALASVATGACTILMNQARQREGAAFTGSCLLIAGLMVAGAAGVFPVMLHSTIAPGDSISAFSGATDAHGLRLALIWWPFAALCAVGYCAFTLRYYRGKVAAS
jgi:cytochrome d ubiquinol oxidase subunit II